MLELRGPFAVFGDHGPVVVPDFVVQRAEVDHRFDGERHPRLEDGGDRRLVVVQHHHSVVEGGTDTVTREITNDVVAEPVCVGLDDAPDN